MTTISTIYKYQKKSTAANDPSLKYYYRFNSTDVSGTTTKLLLNVATQTSDLTLDGTGAQVDTTTGKSAFKITQTPNSAYLTDGTKFYSLTQSWAIKFYITNSNQTYVNIIASYPNSVRGSPYLFTFQGYFNGTVGASPLTIRYYIPNTSFGGEIILTSNASINTWYSAVITQNGTTFKGYLNGVLVQSKVTTSGGALSSDVLSTFVIGREPGGNGTQKYDGYVDEFRIYNKVLTDTEILNLHLYDDLTPTPVPTNQIIHFKGNVNDITGTTVKNYGSITGDGSFSTNTALSNTTNQPILINTTSYKVGDGSLDLSSGSYITMPNIVLKNAGFSFCGWIKTTAPAPNTYTWSRIFDITNTAGTSRILMMCPNETSIEFATQIPGGGLNISPTITNVLSTTVWNHISWTLTTSGVSKYYVNRKYTGTFSTALFPNATTPYEWSLIGASKGYGNPWFKGYLDDIQMFDRVLSDEEITAIFYNTI